jgi:predicted Holliday junction resolvase-like endonuclease
MKPYKKIISLIIILIFNISCDNLQKNIEDKAREIQKTTNKEINEHMPKVDSTIKSLDSTIQKKMDQQLKNADTLIDNLNETLN